MATWCFNADMLKAAALAHAAALVAEGIDQAQAFGGCDFVVAFLCSEEARKLRVNGESVHLAPPPVEVEELEVEEAHVMATPAGDAP